MNTTMIKEEIKDIDFLNNYYNSMGKKIKVLNSEPRPLGTIKELLFEFNISKEYIKSIYVMSYDINKTISYINKDHVDDKFKLFIYGLLNNEYRIEKYNNGRIKIIPSNFIETEHLNLIEFTKELEIDYDEKQYNTKYLLFVEPYHDSDNFGPSYENSNDKLSEYENKLIELLKAKLYIPNNETIEKLKKLFTVS